MYQASSSRHRGPRRSPTARSKRLGQGDLPGMTDAAAQAGQDRNRARPVAARHDGAERDEGLAQQEGRAVGLPRMVEPHGSTGRLGRATRRQRVVDDGEASRPAGLTADDAAQRGNQAEQPEAASREHPVVGLPAQPRCQRQDRPRHLAHPEPAWRRRSAPRGCSGRAPGWTARSPRPISTASPGRRSRVAVPWRHPAFGQTPATWGRAPGGTASNPPDASGPARTRNSSNSKKPFY